MAMLTLDYFDKVETTPTGSMQRVVRMTPKRPIAGLEDLEISVFPTMWRRRDSVVWAWQWSSGGMFYSSEGDAGRPPAEEHFNPESAALAAIKDASYWSDDERLPREEQQKQERKRKQERLDNHISRFLNS